MLIDDLLAAPVIDNVDVRSNYLLKSELIRAQKFELSHEFAATAEGLMANYDTIAHAIPHLRLPFQSTWIEVAQQHRQRFMRAGLHVPEVQGVPTRVGMLLNEVSNTPYRFTAHLFWALLPSETLRLERGMKAIAPLPAVHASHLAMSFDLSRAESAAPVDAESSANKYKYVRTMKSAPEWVGASSLARGRLSEVTRPIETAYKTGLPERMTKEMADLMFELGAADWSGESVFILSVLALYNTVNVVDSSTVDFAKLNKQRVKHHKPALQNHYVLKISPRVKKFIRPSSDKTSSIDDLRGHMVRGHWKVRKTGIYFWRSHMRGDPTRMIDKTYKLEDE